MDVVSKEGPLFFQSVKFGKKTWRKYWTILFEPSHSGVGRMELYDFREAGGFMGFTIKPTGPRKTDKRVIRLADFLSIASAPDEICPTGCSAFFLNTTSCIFTIAAPNQESWRSVLCQLAFQSHGSEDFQKPQQEQGLNQTEKEPSSTSLSAQFQVTVQSTEASQRCRMSGSYLISSEKDAVSLLDLQTGQSVYRWPYRFLRRFSQVKGGIMIEAGRRCDTGKGEFIFLSKKGPKILKAIEDSIRFNAGQEQLDKTTTLLKEFSLQPVGLKIPVIQDKPRVMPRHGSWDHRAPEKPLALPKSRNHVDVDKDFLMYASPQRSRRNICLPIPDSRTDDSMYANILPQSAPAGLLSPTVTASSIQPLYSALNFQRKQCAAMGEEKESGTEENLYTNWTAKRTTEQDVEGLYCNVTFAAKGENRKLDESESKNNAVRKPHANFRQTL